MRQVVELALKRPSRSRREGFSKSSSRGTDQEDVTEAMQELTE
jgi:hypothetical protein